MLLSLVAAAWALRCNGVYAVPDVDMGEVPRNVRWLPTREPSEYERRLEPAPGRPARFEVGTPLRILGIRAGLLAPATAYTVRNPWNGVEARFTTTTRADRRRPEGGRLLGAIPGSFASIVLVHEAVTDESRVFPIVESWSPDATDHRISVGWTVVSAPGTRDDAPWLQDVGGPQLNHIAARTGGAPATLVMRDEMPRCGGSPPSGFDIASTGLPGGGVSIRTRWMDLAGNATPWSEVVAFDYVTEAWVKGPR